MDRQQHTGWGGGILEPFEWAAESHAGIWGRSISQQKDWHTLEPWAGNAQCLDPQEKTLMLGKTEDMRSRYVAGTM